MRKILAVLLLALSSASCSVGSNEESWRMAEEYSRQGQHLRAIEEYSRIVNSNTRSQMAIRAQTQIALTYENALKDYPRAIRAWRDVFRRSSENRVKMQSQWAVARIYAEKLQDAGAAAEEYKELFDKFAKNEKEGPEILLVYVQALMDAGRFSEAAGRCSEFRTLYPGNKDGPRVLLEEGKAHLADRREDKAAESFRELIRNFEGRDGFDSLVAEAYYGLGGALESLGDLAAALESYKKSLSTYPNPKVVETKIERVEKRRKEKKL
jgi:tetratricopeptide (TPR) repeat protein